MFLWLARGYWPEERAWFGEILLDGVRLEDDIFISLETGDGKNR